MHKPIKFGVQICLFAFSLMFISMIAQLGHTQSTGVARYPILASATIPNQVLEARKEKNAAKQKASVILPEVDKAETELTAEIRAIQKEAIKEVITDKIRQGYKEYQRMQKELATVKLKNDSLAADNRQYRLIIAELKATPPDTVRVKRRALIQF